MSTTARSLNRRLWLLLALGAATALALFGSYRGVHDDAVSLAASSSPGVLAVDTTRYALELARDAVPESGPEDAATGDFHTRISVAHQSLALAASENVTGLSGRRTIQTVTGLIAVYSGWVEQANQEPSDSPLRSVYLHYANSVFDAPGTTEDIVGRLGQLRKDQLAEAERQASLDPPLRLGWSAVPFLFLALGGVLAETQRFSRRRFRRTVNPPLFAATVLWTTGTAVLGWISLRTHDAMAKTVAELREPLTGDGIPEAGARVDGYLANVGFWASLPTWILIGGAILMALTAAGLLPRMSEYRFREPQ